LKQNGENIKIIMNTAANESSRKKKLKIWNEEIEKIILNKNLEYTKYLNTKQLEDEIDYKCQRAISKKEIRCHRQSWETFILDLECDLYKVKPKAFKILKYMNQGIKESAKLN
jgi:hypothetical protein